MPAFGVPSVMVCQVVSLAADPSARYRPPAPLADDDRIRGSSFIGTAAVTL